jgi:hypothetical protein
MKIRSSQSTSFAVIAAGLAISLSQAALAGDQDKLVRRQSFCAAYGAGFVPVEGTQTCVRVSGHVRVEMEVGRPLRFEEASPFATPRAEGLTAVSSPESGPLDPGSSVGR